MQKNDAILLRFLWLGVPAAKAALSPEGPETAALDPLKAALLCHIYTKYSSL